MTDHDQKELGNTLWKIADDLRGAMNADDFRDYMLSFLFLRYLSDNYELAAKKNWAAITPYSKQATVARLYRSGMPPMPTIPLPLKNKCAARCTM